jgi:uncharacterized repeat protein (TIGR03803 family)
MRLRLPIFATLALAAAVGRGQTYADFHHFGNDTDGQNPTAGVGLDNKGNMYGTTQGGGLYGGGVVWEITQAGVYRELHNLGRGTDGDQPWWGVTLDVAGNLYGTADLGGANANGGGGYGMAWEITKAGAYKDLHDLGSGSDGTLPIGEVTLDSAGDLYGTTSERGL